LRDEEDFAALVTEVAAKLAAEKRSLRGVYVTPTIHTDRGIPAEVVFAGVEHGRREAEREHGIKVRWLPDFPGIMAPTSASARWISYRRPSWKALSDSTWRDRGRSRAIRPGIHPARAAGLHSVPHAGETEGPDEVWSAIRRLAPSGSGTASGR